MKFEVRLNEEEKLNNLTFANVIIEACDTLTFADLKAETIAKLILVEMESRNGT